MCILLLNPGVRRLLCQQNGRHGLKHLAVKKGAFRDEKAESITQPQGVRKGSPVSNAIYTMYTSSPTALNLNVLGRMRKTSREWQKDTERVGRSCYRVLGWCGLQRLQARVFGGAWPLRFSWAECFLQKKGFFMFFLMLEARTASIWHKASADCLLWNLTDLAMRAAFRSLILVLCWLQVWSVRFLDVIVVFFAVFAAGEKYTSSCWQMIIKQIQSQPQFDAVRRLVQPRLGSYWMICANWSQVRVPLQRKPSAWARWGSVAAPNVTWRAASRRSLDGSRMVAPSAKLEASRWIRWRMVKIGWPNVYICIPSHVYHPMYTIPCPIQQVFHVGWLTVSKFRAFVGGTWWYMMRVVFEQLAGSPGKLRGAERRSAGQAVSCSCHWLGHVGSLAAPAVCWSCTFPVRPLLGQIGSVEICWNARSTTRSMMAVYISKTRRTSTKLAADSMPLYPLSDFNFVGGVSVFLLKMRLPNILLFFLHLNPTQHHSVALWPSLAHILFFKLCCDMLWHVVTCCDVSLRGLCGTVSDQRKQRDHHGRRWKEVSCAPRGRRSGWATETWSVKAPVAGMVLRKDAKGQSRT